MDISKDNHFLELLDTDGTDQNYNRSTNYNESNEFFN